MLEPPLRAVVDDEQAYDRPAGRRMSGASTPRLSQDPETMGRLDGVLFVAAGLAAAWLAYLLFRAGLQPGWPALLLVVFWLLVAYLVLPRLHRILTRVYVPGYFIGRTRTSDGLLGDPVNIALLGDEAQVHAAMAAAGWTRADDVNLASSRRIVSSTLTRRSYPEAPVSPLHLFDRQQDFAYQQEVAGNPAKRHHVRFWRCPEGWMLPGGYPVDWLAAGTYDRSVGLSLMTFQVTHKIAPDIDTERDFTVGSIQQGHPAVTVRLIRNFSTGYHDKNGGGDAIVTDGDLPVVDLRQVPAPATAAVEPTDSRDRRPPPIVFGAGVALTRGLLYLTVATLVLLGTSASDVLPPGAQRVSEVSTEVGLLLAGAVDVVLALGTFRGRNWARVVLSVLSLVTIVAAFLAAANGGPRPTLGTGLPSVALSILVMLALTSQSARAFSLRSRHRRPVRTGTAPAPRAS
jgi:hypothetical protein